MELNKVTKEERDILESTKEFAVANGIPYNEKIEYMILNAMRESVKRCVLGAIVTQNQN